MKIKKAAQALVDWKDAHGLDIECPIFNRRIENLRAALAADTGDELEKQLRETTSQRDLAIKAHQESADAAVRAGVHVSELSQEVERLQRGAEWHQRGHKVADSFLDKDKPSESHIVDKICVIGWERDSLRTQLSQCQERKEKLRVFCDKQSSNERGKIDDPDFADECDYREGMADGLLTAYKELNRLEAETPDDKEEPK